METNLGTWPSLKVHRWTLRITLLIRVSISSNGAMHYFTVMYLAFKINFSLGSLFNTQLIYNEQEAIFAYLFVGISI